MKLIELNKERLIEYKAIEMVKEVYEERVYHSLESYEIKSVNPFTIDMNLEEDLSEWMTLINFDKSKIFAIESSKTLIAGAIIITNSERVNMLKIIPNSACLWDIRVRSDHQGKGLGKMLFNACVHYAKERNKEAIVIETQHNNVSAIRFYESLGAKLYQVNKNHYQGMSEDQLLFVYSL